MLSRLRCEEQTDSCIRTVAGSVEKPILVSRLVAEHRLDKDEAFEVIQDLTVNLVRKAYKV
jgi:hypothetical protein